MIKIDSSILLNVLSSLEPNLIFFRNKDEPPDTYTGISLFDAIDKFFKLKIYEYVIDANKENQVMADLLKINNSKTIIFSNNGQFKRFSSEKFDLPTVAKIITANLDIIKKD